MREYVTSICIYTWQHSCCQINTVGGWRFSKFVLIFTTMEGVVVLAGEDGRFNLANNKTYFNLVYTGMWCTISVIQLLLHQHYLFSHALILMYDANCFKLISINAVGLLISPINKIVGFFVNPLINRITCCFIFRASCCSWLFTALLFCYIFTSKFWLFAGQSFKT